MAENSSIEWTDHTFNPWWGCQKVSPGCDNCYAERDANRFAPGRVLWGAASERREFGSDHWRAPLKWNAQAADKGKRTRVFCASMADVFDHHPIAEAERGRLWELIRCTPNLDWQILTKRIGNVRTRLPDDWGIGYPNVWLGISVVNQEETDRDIPKLCSIPAAMRWLSIEPLLGPITLGRHLFTCCGHPVVGGEYMGQLEMVCCGEPEGTTDLDWVVAGGESGPRARPANPEWFRAIRDQCVRADVPFLFKQWGEFDECQVRVGKKVAGRLLDGITHDGYPR